MIKAIFVKGLLSIFRFRLGYVEMSGFQGLEVTGLPGREERICRIRGVVPRHLDGKLRDNDLKNIFHPAISIGVFIDQP